MITRIEAYGFRCLKETKQSLRPFQILVGPNASGKSAFMDALAFLGTLVSEGLEAAVTERIENFHDLVWGREGNELCLAVEALAPEVEIAHFREGGRLLIEPVPGYEKRVTEREVTVTSSLPGPVDRIETLPRRQIRYELQVRINVETETVIISEERITLKMPGSNEPIQLTSRDSKQARFKDENGREHGAVLEVNPNYSALVNQPYTAADAPSAFWLKNLLIENVCKVLLDAEKLRKPSPPYRGRIKTFDGSHLARFVADLQDKFPDLFGDWVNHLRTCLPDFEAVRTVLRPEDRHRYLMLRHKNGIEVPSWVVSDGTLRIMALTVLAYLPTTGQVYLVEEPENGVHPTAIEAIYQSLSSVYDGQVFMASHSPILLNLAKPEELLCFLKTDEGTEVIAGDQHPVLMNWKGEVALSDLFVGGVLS